MPAADLELGIHRLPDSTYAARIRFTSPGGNTDAVLASNIPVSFDVDALTAATLDPNAYGRKLTAMLFADQHLQDSWQKARAYTHGAHSTLRLRLCLDPADKTLHTLRWETLRDPVDNTPLALNEQVLFSRYLDTSDLTPVVIPPRPALSALVVIASPSDLSRYEFAEIDIEGEVGRAQAALGSIRTTIVANYPNAHAPQVTLAAITAALRDGPHILYLVCHGRIVSDAPYLFLEREDGTTEPVSGAALVQTIAQLPHRPLLTILASCQSAGHGYGDALAALGPQLVRVGLPAMIGFQGNVAMSTVKQLLGPLFTELQRDGQIDRALAAARSSIDDNGPWWQAVLWLRIRDGHLWTTRPRRKPFIVAALMLFCLAIASGSLWYKYVVLAPMPDGWNIVVAGIGVSEQGTVAESDLGRALSDRLYNDLTPGAAHIKSWRDPNVGFILGDLATQEQQAATIAERTNADIVIYGVIMLTTQGWADFEPRFYIRRPAVPYGSEIFGSEQFGRPISFSLLNDSAQSELQQRIDVMRDFFQGIQDYDFGQYAAARGQLQAALKDAEATNDPQILAIIYTFLGALEYDAQTYVQSGDYLKAIDAFDRAHRLWPAYAKPYLGRAAVLYQRAREQLSGSLTIATASQRQNLACFDPVSVDQLDIIDQLRLSTGCYEEARSVPGQTQTADIETKVQFSKGELAFVLSMHGGEDRWEEARALFKQVIAAYNTPDKLDPTRQMRLQRLAAHSYARLGLMIICYPDCDKPQTKSNAEYTEAAQDYEQAINLLRVAAGCQEQLSLCNPGDDKIIALYQQQLLRLRERIGS